MTRPARRLLDALACGLVAVLGATALVALVIGVACFWGGMTVGRARVRLR
jgi:hypothetical protein